ncbi:hypothetical protein ABIA33_007550 [Streptacidiphilus sp. MAP12-16]|uniref:putative quinol monooxygenase n=1 Tax=Streptacidiphilus sp. MAP12-16 TaxID=3156300 RepID=UPI003515CAA5
MERMMSKIGLLARIEAKPEYADQVEALLQGALDLARGSAGLSASPDDSSQVVQCTS